MEIVITAARWAGLGIAFDVSQRAFDFLLDHVFQQVAWLAWLTN